MNLLNYEGFFWGLVIYIFAVALDQSGSPLAGIQFKGVVMLIMGYVALYYVRGKTKVNSGYAIQYIAGFCMTLILTSILQILQGASNYILV